MNDSLYSQAVFLNRDIIPEYAFTDDWEVNEVVDYWMHERKLEQDPEFVYRDRNVIIFKDTMMLFFNSNMENAILEWADTIK